MPQFERNQPVTTNKPLVQVDTQLMRPGEYTFQLVVVDDQGRQSEPTTITITIQQAGRLRPAGTSVSRPARRPARTQPKSRRQPKGKAL